MIITFDTIKKDIEAFADDINEVAIDRNQGKVLFARNGRDIEFKILQEEGVIKNIEFEGQEMPYVMFLEKEVANLYNLAERIAAKRSPVDAFIDGPATLDSFNSGQEDGQAIKLLRSECVDKNSFNSKVVFITADAGHGKTALLRQFQYVQARKYLSGEADFLFWHIDLQGRQLVRISEALMSDLGELRVTGLWMQSLIRLMQHGKLIVGIDGFDELAAEQGNNDAIGALALLVNQLENSGVLVAASRRTFFDTDDYLGRSKLIQGKENNFCVFNQINLENWRKTEAIDYLLCKDIEDPEATYSKILNLLGGLKEHPILTRPFLLAQFSNAITKHKLSPEEFVGGMKNPHDPNKGINSIIEAFVKREVSEKWKIKDTGKPYLNEQQHLRLLSSVAEEMWKAQNDRLELDIIETIVVILMDEWNIFDKDLRQQIFNMVKMHALLVVPNDGSNDYRAFEHPEFKDYFTSLSLEKIILYAYDTNNFASLSSFLSVAQISDSLALYTFTNSILENKDLKGLLKIFEELVSKEWKPTFLQANVGTLIPYLLRGYDLDENVEFKGKVIYSSLIFENKQFKNFTIAEGNFLSTSFGGSTFENVEFINCQFNEISFDSRTVFKNSKFVDCNYNGIKICENEDDPRLEYSPIMIYKYLREIGIKVIDSNAPVQDEEEIVPHKYSKIIYRLLRAMKRTTFISENNINTRLKSDKNVILNNIIPLMEAHSLIEKRQDKGEVWSLKSSYQEISIAEFESGKSRVHEFWDELRRKYS